LVDLGTEFGVEVKAAGMHAEVFTGKAAVKLPEQASEDSGKGLTKEMAVAVASGSHFVHEDVPHPLAFVRKDAMDARVLAGSGPYGTWKAFSQALSMDSHLVAYYPFDAESAATGKLINRAAATAGKFDGEVQGATWEPGRFAEKSALHFDGSTSRVAVKIDGQYRKMTLATWVDIHQY